MSATETPMSVGIGPSKDARLARLLRALADGISLRGIPSLMAGTRHLLLGRERALFRLDDGIELLLDPNDYFECMMYYGRFCPEILDVLRRFARPGYTVLDVGGHVGYFATKLAKIVGAQGRVFTFEPDPRAREILIAAIQANRMDWVQVMPIALSRQSGFADFFLAGQLGWSTAVKNTHLTDLQQVEVRTATLDSLIADGVIPTGIRLIKVDVEGFEFEVLNGASQVLTGARAVLLLEINTQMLAAQGTSSRQIIEFVRRFDYKVYLVDKQLRWWRTLPRTRLLPVSNPELPDSDIVCVPREIEMPEDTAPSISR